MKNCIPPIVLFASLCLQVFAASGSPVSRAEPPQSSEANGPLALQWDHNGHIRACEARGSRNCPVVAIPPGIKNEDILSIVRTRVVPGAKFEVAIMGRKNVYLCASGIGGYAKLLCQKMPVPDPSIAKASPSSDVAAVAAAHLQNTISLLTSRSMATPVNRTSANAVARPVNRTTNLVGAGGGGCGYDEDTVESICEGESGGGGGVNPDPYPGSGGEEPAPYSNIPDPGGSPPADPGNAGGSAEDIAAPWISIAIADSERTFSEGGANFRPNPDECNIAVARCRDDCGDRTNSLYGMCITVAGLIAAPSKIAGAVFAIACAETVYQRGARCKKECIFTVIPCGR